MIEQFPAEAVPDGAVFAPHHYWGIIIGLLACAVVWDDYRHREPVVVAVLLGVGVASFAVVWRWYPVTGALLAFAPAFALLEAVRTWPGRYPRRWLYLLGVGVLIGMDDWASHALGVWSPLDAFWRAHMVPVIA